MSGTGPAGVPIPQRCAHLPTDSRGYPIIATVGRDEDTIDFGTVSEYRKLVLATFDLCGVCGLPFGEELRWQVGFRPEALEATGGIEAAEAPVHEICALYSAQVCPFVSSPYARLGDEYRKGARRPEQVILAGSTRTEQLCVRPSPWQPGTKILTFRMADLTRSHVLHDAEQARAAYTEALADDTPLALDTQQEQLTALLCPLTQEENGGLLAGAAWCVGAAFCPDLGAVLGMDVFARDSRYRQVAEQTVLDAGFADAYAGTKRDASLQAGLRWLSTRTELPELLKHWRRSARGRLVRTARKDNGPSQEQRRKSARRKQKAARRRNR
ncbi:hypothetical protein [Allokutzneria oryzae]|uniref:Uncharacterized protein n=1 Tax=Allokutzneria oryzae TaxID=1378989 RepID=A0ABV5ZSZ1_9PSEU